jgi:predicted Zn-dependent protease
VPANADAGKQIHTRVELADVMPTMLEAVGVSVPKEVQGKSLLPLIDQGDKTEKDQDVQAYSETDYPHGSFGWSPLRSVRTGKYLYVQAPRQELYDETLNSSEDHNLASASPAVAQALGSQLVTFRDKTKSTPTAQAEVNPEEAAKIRALGYIPATGHSDSDKVQGVDPKDKVEIFNAMTQVNYLMEEGKNDVAIARLKGVVAQDPTILSAYQTLAGLYLRSGDKANAIATLRKITEVAPDMASVHYELGMLLKNSKDLGGAQPELEKAAARWPKMAELQYQLAEVYVNTEQLDSAAKSAKEALKLKPGYFDADLLLGFLYVHENKPSEAIPYLQDASTAHPNSPRPHEYMAQAYDEMGVEGLANQERDTAERLKQGAGH